MPKSLAVGFIGLGSQLSIDIDGNRIDLSNPKPASNYYIGYTGNSGKYAIYLTLEAIEQNENGKVGIIHVTVNDYDTSIKLKEYTLKLNAEWHEFDELV